jgi:hypothetical protein
MLHLFQSVKRYVPLIPVLFLLGMQSATAQEHQSLPPQIIDVLPLPGVEIGTREPLIITFDQPMRDASVSLQFEPQLQGELRWIFDHTVSFLPESGTWEINRQYTVIVEGTATEGLPMAAPYEFTVQTTRGFGSGSSFA